MSGTALSKTFRLTFTALFIALVLFLGLTPFGLIPLGFINVTLLCVPVAVGCVLLGLKTGLCLGLCFGLVSLLSALGLSGVPASALAGALVARSPLLAALMCFVPRLLVPLAVWGVYRALSRGGRSVKAACAAAVAGSVVNTAGYLGLMLLFYILTGLDSREVLAAIAGTGLIAGGAEAVVAGILAGPILAALWKIRA